jgi:hypothetical protein
LEEKGYDWVERESSRPEWRRSARDGPV